VSHQGGVGYVLRLVETTSTHHIYVGVGKRNPRTTIRVELDRAAYGPPPPVIWASLSLNGIERVRPPALRGRTPRRGT